MIRALLLLLGCIWCHELNKVQSKPGGTIYENFSSMYNMKYVLNLQTDQLSDFSDILWLNEFDSDCMNCQAVLPLNNPCSWRWEFMDSITEAIHRRKRAFAVSLHLKVSQVFRGLMNDTCKMDLILFYPPHSIALACIYNASILKDKDPTVLFEELHMDINAVKIFDMEILDLFEYCRPDNRGGTNVPEASANAALIKLAATRG